MGAGIGIGSFLSGFGKGYLERKDRQERLKIAATQAGLKQLVGMMDDPSFDPAAKQDALGAYFTTLGDLQGGKGASRNAKGQKNDPLQHMQEMVGGMLNKTYPEGQAQAGAPPVLSPRPDASGGREELAPGSAGKMERKGPFRGTGEIREQIEQDERRKAQIREGEALKRQQLTAQLKLAEKAAEEKQRKANYDTMIGTGMDKAEAFAMSYPGRANPFIQRGAQAGPKAGTPVKVTLQDGTSFDAWEDKYTRKFTKLDGTEIDAKTIKAINPKAETGDKGVLGELEAAKRKLADPLTPKPEREAAQMFVDSYKHRDTATTLRIVNGQQGATPVGDIDLADPKYADKVALARQAIRRGTGDPSFGLGANNPDRKIYYQIKGKLLAQMGDGEAAAEQASYAAGKATLTELTKLRGQMKAAEAGTVYEIDRLQALNKLLPRSNIRAFNTAEQFFKANLTAAPDLARFREALLAARFRYNSMITSLKSGGTSTNQVRSETAEEIINRTMAKGTIEAAAQEMKVGVANVMRGMDAAVDDTRKEMVKAGGGGVDKDSSAPKLPKASRKGQLITVDQATEFIKAAGGDVEKGKNMAREAEFQVP